MQIIMWNSCGFSQGVRRLSTALEKLIIVVESLITNGSLQYHVQDMNKWETIASYIFVKLTSVVKLVIRRKEELIHERNAKQDKKDEWEAERNQQLDASVYSPFVPFPMGSQPMLPMPQDGTPCDKPLATCSQPRLTSANHTEKLWWGEWLPQANPNFNIIEAFIFNVSSN